jgi:small subunit ribosomal protein S15
MALTKPHKDKIIKDFKSHEKDTGSPEVQVALLSNRIAALTEHLKSHKQDFHSRQGLFKMVGQRRRLLVFLAKSDKKRHDAVVKKLNLRSK